MWEDKANAGGGRFVLHIKKLFSNKTWEDILLATIITDEKHEKVNGVVVSIRGWEVLLSVWMKKLTDELREYYRNWIRASLGMTENIKIEYKEFPDPESLKQKAHEDKNRTEFEEVRHYNNSKSKGGFMDHKKKDQYVLKETKEKKDQREARDIKYEKELEDAIKAKSSQKNDNQQQGDAKKGNSKEEPQKYEKKNNDNEEE